MYLKKLFVVKDQIKNIRKVQNYFNDFFYIILRSKKFFHIIFMIFTRQKFVKIFFLGFSI